MAPVLDRQCSCFPVEGSFRTGNFSDEAFPGGADKHWKIIPPSLDGAQKFQIHAGIFAETQSGIEYKAIFLYPLASEI
jgi:hypothetical protein